MGAAPRIMLLNIPVMIASIAAGIMFSPVFHWGFTAASVRYTSAAVLLVSGIVILIHSGLNIINAFKNKRLATEGFYRYTQNPMYSSYSFFIIPGVSLLLNNWLFLAVSATIYMITLKLISSEESPLLKIFGNDYRNYTASTPFYLPLPKFPERLKIIFRIIIAVPLMICAILITLFTIARYIHLPPPASALLSLPKMLCDSLQSYFLLFSFLYFLITLPIAISRNSTGILKRILLLIRLITFLLNLIPMLMLAEVKPEVSGELLSEMEDSRVLSNTDLSSNIFWNYPVQSGHAGFRNVHEFKEINIREGVTVTKIIPQPRTNQNAVHVVYLSSGNWQDEDITTAAPLLSELASNGYETSYLTMRTRFETNLEGILSDILAGLNYLQSETGGNEISFYLCGGSSGGHLSLLTALSDEIKSAGIKLSGVIAYYPVTDFPSYAGFFKRNFEKLSPIDHLGTKVYCAVSGESMQETQRSTEYTLFGSTYNKNPDIFIKGSPIHHLSENVPPILIIHGKADDMAPYIDSRRFYNRAMKMNIDCCLVSLPFTNHAFDKVMGVLTPAAHISIIAVKNFINLTGVKHE